MWRRLSVLVRKEFIQILREPRRRNMLFLPPLIQLIVFGYVVNLDVEHARIAWMDLDHTQASRNLLDDFKGSPYFRITSIANTEDDVRRLLDNGDVSAVVRVLPGFSRDLERGNTTAVQILIDGTDSNTASIVSSYANQVIATFSSDMMIDKQRREAMARMPLGSGPAMAALPTLNVQYRVWFNASLKTRDFFVPSTIVQIITGTTLMLTALSIVREKELGTIEQLMVTPLRPIELMIGKTLPSVVIGIVQIILVISTALIIFHTPFRGSPLLLLACGFLFVQTTLGVGLFISTIADTQQQAAMSSFFFFMPAFLLSGFQFPIRNMPMPVQYLTYLNPLRYFIQIVEGIFLKGVGLSVLWPQMVALAVFGVLIMGLSSLRFRKRLD
jgi:drug efflux transport system permease protein